MLRIDRRLFGLLLTLVLCGCGSAGEERYPVTGLVSVNGRPLDRGRIRFLPAANAKGRCASGGIIDGRFAIPREEGLFAGEYRVEIEAAEDLGFDLDDDLAFSQRGVAVLPPNGIPPQFNRESMLECSVSEDATNEFDFDLNFSAPQKRGLR